LLLLLLLIVVCIYIRPYGSLIFIIIVELTKQVQNNLGNMLSISAF